MGYDIVGRAGLDIIGDDESGYYPGSSGYYPGGGASGDVAELLAAASGDEEIIGAVRRAISMRRGGGRAPVPVHPMGRGQVTVKDSGPTQVRRLALNFTPDTGNPVAGGASFTCSARPQKPQRADRLVVPAVFGSLFVITDVKVGTNSQFNQAREALAAVFAEDGNDCNLVGDSAVPGVDVSISGTNITGAPQRFNATIFGVALQ